MTVQSDWAVLSDEQRQFFDDNGYLMIEDALPPDVVAELNAAADEIYDREKAAERLEKTGKLNLRNCIVHHDAFLQLLDWPDYGSPGVADSQLEYPDDYFSSHCFALWPRASGRGKAQRWVSPRWRFVLSGNDRTPSAHSAQNCLCHQRPDRSRIGGDATRAREQSAVWQACD